jgi:hypothetical protein
MKKLIRLLVSAALLATLALPGLAQTTPTTPATTPAATQDDTEAKAASYKTFTDNFKTNPQVAYEAGKGYLEKYEAKAATDDDKKIVAYIKKWVDSYDKIARRNQLLQKIKDKNYPEAVTLSRQVLTDYPDDLPVLFELSQAGLFAATGGNEANNADTINFARKTMQLIQAGKTFQKDTPIANKDVILGGLNYSLGFLLKKSQPAEALNYFITAAQFEGPSKKDPLTYASLAEIYEATEYSKLATQFNASCKTEDQVKTQECIDLKAKADQSVDHLIDALARAIAYSNLSPEAAKFAQARASWTEGITGYYKYRNNGSDAGLKELIAGITSKPLPKPGAPVAPMTPTTTTTPSSTTTPTQPSGTPGMSPSGASPTTTAKPSSTTTTTPAATTTTQPNGKAPATTQPAAKTSTTKTTPKRAHSSKRN